MVFCWWVVQCHSCGFGSAWLGKINNCKSKFRTKRDLNTIFILHIPNIFFVFTVCKWWTTIPDTIFPSSSLPNSMIFIIWSSTQVMAGLEFKTGFTTQMHNSCKLKLFYLMIFLNRNFLSDSAVHTKRHIRLHTTKSARELYPDEKKKN